MYLPGWMSDSCPISIGNHSTNDWHPNTDYSLSNKTNLFRFGFIVPKFSDHSSEKHRNRGLFFLKIVLTKLAKLHAGTKIEQDNLSCMLCRGNYRHPLSRYAQTLLLDSYPYAVCAAG